MSVVDRADRVDIGRAGRIALAADQPAGHQTAVQAGGTGKVRVREARIDLVAEENEQAPAAIDVTLQRSTAGNGSAPRRWPG